MRELIDREQVLKDMGDRPKVSSGSGLYALGAINQYDMDRLAIETSPTVDAVPVVRCAVCRHFQCNMRGDGTLPNGVDEFECRNGRGGCDPMDFCDEGERKDGDHND